jgi:hypothetical protein
LKVFWDAVSLQPGVPWEQGFCDGLVQSRVFVPPLARGALQNLPAITADAPCDNVLLEYRLAQEFRGLGLLEFVFPVFIGDCVDSAVLEAERARAEGAVASVQGAGAQR